MKTIGSLAELQDFIANNEKVLVDFYATWCGPCNMLTPHLDQMETEMSAIKFARVDVDEADDVARAYNIVNIPHIILYQKGQQFKTVVGFALGDIAVTLKELLDQ